MATIHSRGNGYCFTIRFGGPKGRREVFLQGDDAARLQDDLDQCRTRADKQRVLDGYEHIAVSVD